MRVSNEVCAAVIAALLGVCTAAVGLAAETVTCQSSDGGRVVCPCDTSNGVRLARELGERPCTGHWGLTDEGVWVDDGCRAEFELGGGEGAATKGLGTLLGALIGGQPPGESGRLVCESKGNRRAHCEADTSGGVRLVRRLSRAACEGHWGYDAGGIWVDNGCRAEFEVVTTTPTPEPTAPPTAAAGYLVCESKDNRRAYCEFHTSGGVRLVRELGDSPCLGHWGYDSGGVWVSDGCGAIFERLAPTPTPTPEPETVVCESKDGGRAYCSADTSRGVFLARQLSRAACEGHWGYDAGGVWVDDGCRAELGLGRATPTPTAEQQRRAAGRIVCRSHGATRHYCPAEVTVGVRLVRKLGTATCVGAWGFDGHAIWVESGCQAEFKVE